MKKRSHINNTFRNAMVYGGATIVSKIIAFFMLPVYANCLGAEGYGIVGMVDVVISVATMMIGYGIAGAMWRFYFQKETEEERNSLVATTIILMFILVVAASIPLLLFHNLIGHFAFGRDDLGYFIIIATIAFVFEMTSRTAEAYILIKQKPFMYSALAIFKMVLGLSLNIYFIVFRGMGALGFLYSSLVSSFISSIFNHSYTLYHVGTRFEKAVAKELLGYSLPLLPGYIAMFVRSNADRVIMRTFMGLAQVGAYEMLNKFVSLVGILVVEPLSKSWDPKRLEICDTPEGPETISRMFTLQLAIMLFIGLILALEIPLLLRILTPPDFWLNGWVVFLMIIARILSYSYYQLYFGLMYAKKTTNISRIQMVSSVIDVVFNLILIPHLGILGAVITSCFTYFSQCSIAFFLARRHYVIPFQWNKIIHILVIVLLLFAGISQFSIDKIGLAEQFNKELTPIVTNIMTFLHLDTIKKGKLLSYVVKDIGLLVEIVMKLVLSLFFLPALAYVNIIPRKFFKLKIISRPAEILPEI